ncbi:MAG: porphobilinogen synthase [Deltaproteobacteria bacterium]|nr:porphobilinogen synthase [Deltaproteobacteria bacterium]MBW1922106.1 porphobilinogen synthase [Deltaproteobacteria bacterium]MBW1947923.1 porphobilinogen synthase [Deltaproteobacteria bacterium]
MRIRPRRLRRSPGLRAMVRETHVQPTDFIAPLFVKPGKGIRDPIGAMPGQYQFSVDTLVQEARELRDLGVPSVIIFGLPDRKDPVGSRSWADDGVVQQAVSALKEALPDLVVITDVCLCEYTDHGHCGVIRNGEVDNDATLELLARQAVSHAGAGADLVAPSDMMDGRVAAIREALDDSGYENTGILSYAAKYASAFYGPFREAAESAPQFGDRRGYQMDPANALEALREVELDLEEGADMVMVKPALAYLDVIRQVRDYCTVPLAAYNVSGEYAMVKAAAQNGWVDGDLVMMETLTAVKRAGADLILTYFAKDASRLLNR